MDVPPAIQTRQREAPHLHPAGVPEAGMAPRPPTGSRSSQTFTFTPAPYRPLCAAFQPWPSAEGARSSLPKGWKSQLKGA